MLCTQHLDNVGLCSYHYALYRDKYTCAWSTVNRVQYPNKARWSDYGRDLEYSGLSSSENTYFFWS